MLEWLGAKGDSSLLEIAKSIEQGISTVIKEETVRTYDMGGSNTTLEVAEEVVKKMT